MDVVSRLTRQFMDHMTSMYREGHLDDQFTELQKLQDESDPDFVYEVVSLFFKNSEKLLNNLANFLHKQIVDYQEVCILAHQFKGSCASIGAHKVKKLCDAFRNSCQENNRDGCLEGLQKLQHEYNVLKSKLGHLFMLKQQIVAAGGQVPTMF